MARPTKNNPTGAQKSSKKTVDAVNKLEQAAMIDASIDEMCFFAEISLQTYYNWIKKDPKLLERLTKLRNSPTLRARMTIVNGLEMTDNARWYLERKVKNEFSSRNEVTGANGESLMMTDEERAEAQRVFPNMNLKKENGDNNLRKD